MNQDWPVIVESLSEPKPFEEFEYILDPIKKEGLTGDIPAIVNPIFLQKDTFTHMFDENEQKSFSNFLDSFLAIDDCSFPISYRDKTVDRKRSNSNSSCRSKRNKTTKELLTEDEKRTNHITSEQKRRKMIRNGFKELTDLVPGIKDINSTKSAILFKSAEFIRRTEQRNKALREKIEMFKLRVKMKHCEKHIEDRTENSEELPLRTKNALLVHKAEQKQLLLLQKQLQMHKVAQKQKQTAFTPMFQQYSILQNEEENKAIRIL